MTAYQSQRWNSAIFVPCAEHYEVVHVLMWRRRQHSRGHGAQCNERYFHHFTFLQIMRVWKISFQNTVTFVRGSYSTILHKVLV